MAEKPKARTGGGYIHLPDDTTSAPRPGVAPEGTDMTVLDELLSPPPAAPLPEPVTAAPASVPKARTTTSKHGTVTQVIE